MDKTQLLSGLSPATLSVPVSGIVATANHGRISRHGEFIPLYVGEGHLPTPDFICEAANRSLAAGETFYTWQRGIPELRQALADYHSRIYGIANDPERYFVTGSGMQAVQIGIQAVAGHGDEIIVPTPAWPNLLAATKLTGARVKEVPMRFGADGWSLDIEALAGAVTNDTKAIVVNSPSNPTGWTASNAQLLDILALARRHGLWILADEVYGRFYYDGAVAPSYHQLGAPDDRILILNTFSKNWAMTGWRIGWLSAPAELGQIFENLVQYSTSGVPVFSQRAAIAALNDGEWFFGQQIALAEKGREIVRAAFTASRAYHSGRLGFVPPKGAFYQFFGIDGAEQGVELTKRIIDEAGVGLAPGNAFGDAGSGFLRLCFLRDPINLARGLDRFLNWLDHNN